MSFDAVTAAAAVAGRVDANEIGECTLRSRYIGTSVEDLISGTTRSEMKRRVSSDLDEITGSGVHGEVLKGVSESDSKKSVNRREKKRVGELGLSHQYVSDRSSMTVIYLSHRRNDWLGGCKLSAIQSASICYYTAVCQHVCPQNVSNRDVKDDDNAPQHFTKLLPAAKAVTSATTPDFTADKYIEEQAIISVEMKNMLLSNGASVSSDVLAATLVEKTSETATTINTKQKSQRSSKKSIAAATTIAEETEVTKKTNATTTSNNRSCSARAKRRPTIRMGISSQTVTNFITAMMTERNKYGDNIRLLSAPVNKITTTEPTKEELVQSTTPPTGINDSNSTNENVHAEMCEPSTVSGVSQRAVTTNTTVGTSKVAAYDLPSSASALFGTPTVEGIELHQLDETVTTESTESLQRASTMRMKSNDNAEDRHEHEPVVSSEEDREEGYDEKHGAIVKDDAADSQRSHHFTDDRCEQLNSYYKAFLSWREKEKERVEKLACQLNNPHTVSDRSPTTVLYLLHQQNDWLSPVDGCSLSANQSSTLCYYVTIHEHVCLENVSQRDVKDDDDARQRLLRQRSVDEGDIPAAVGLEFTGQKDTKRQRASRNMNNSVSMISCGVSADTDVVTDDNDIRTDQSVSAAVLVAKIFSRSTAINAARNSFETKKRDVAEKTIGEESEMTKKRKLTTISCNSPVSSAPLNKTTVGTEELMKLITSSGVINNQSPIRENEQHKQRLRSKEVKLQQQENQSLNLTVDCSVYMTMNTEQENYVMRLERDLMALNQSFVELKTENEQLRQRNFEAAATTNKRNKVVELSNIINNQTSLLGSLQKKFIGLDMKMLQLENKLLQSTVDRSVDMRMTQELENHVMRLEHEMMTFNQSFVELKTDKRRQRKVEAANDGEQQRVVEELLGIVSNQSSFLGTLQDKFVGLEHGSQLLVERILNQSHVMSEMMLHDDMTNSVQLKNHVMHLEHDLMTLNQSFVELKTENDQLRQRSFKDAPTANEQRAVDELNDIISNQSSLLVTLQKKFVGLERDNRLLVERILNQSLMMNEMMRQVEALGREQTKQTQQLMTMKQHGSDNGKPSTVSHSHPSLKHTIKFPDPPIYKTNDGVSPKGRQHFLID